MNITSLFQGVSIIAWLAVAGVVALLTMAAAKNRPVHRGGVIILVVLVIAILFTTVGSGMVFVNPEERGVVISAIAPNGYRSEALNPGLHWIIPFAKSVVRYPVSKQTYTMSATSSEGQVKGDDSIEARTSDGQKVLIDASVIYSVDPAQVVQIHVTWQGRYSADLVRPLARGVIRDAVSQYGIEQVYSSKRLEMVENIRAELNKKLADNGLTLSDFVLRNISFSTEYAASIEQKQIAQQQAEQAKFVVEQRVQEADQAREVAKGKADASVTEAQGQAKSRIIEAQAEAQALGLIADALKDNPDLLTYQYITKISPNVQVMLLPNNSPFLLTLPQMGPQLPEAAAVPVEPTAQPTPLPTPTVVTP